MYQIILCGKNRTTSMLFKQCTLECKENLLAQMRSAAAEDEQRKAGGGEQDQWAEGEDVQTEAKNDADEGKIHQVEQALEWSVQN